MANGHAEGDNNTWDCCGDGNNGDQSVISDTEREVVSQSLHRHRLPEIEHHKASKLTQYLSNGTVVFTIGKCLCNHFWESGISGCGYLEVRSNVKGARGLDRTVFVRNASVCGNCMK